MSAQSGVRPRKRLFILGIVIFLIHVAAIVLFSARHNSTPENQKKLVTVTLHRAAEELPLSQVLFEQDPMFFASPSADNFSAEAWFKFVPPVYEPPSFQDGPSYLELQDVEFSQEKSSLTNQELRLFDLRLPDKPMVFLPPSAPITSRSSFRVEELNNRQLAGAEQPPAIVHPDALSSSVVEIGVDPFGQVISARILSKAGLESADRIALSLALRMRFSPSRNAPISWGKVVFTWHTVAEASPK